MGSPLSEPDRWEDEGPRHEVRIARPFAVGRYEVTFAEWDACRRAGRCSHSFRMLRGGSWDDAAARVCSAIRHWEAADTRSDVIGFRVARTLD